MFCLDEYETLEIYQKKILNTLIKQVGNAPYTFKIGVRNRLSIVTDTLIDAQPIQDPADFTTVDIISDLKGESFEKFASTVISQRFDLIDRGDVDPAIVLPALTLEREADLLGAGRVKEELLSKMTSDSTADEIEVEFLRNLSNLQACMVSKWADSHDESPSAVLRFAMENLRNGMAAWSITAMQCFSHFSRSGSARESTTLAGSSTVNLPTETFAI